MGFSMVINLIKLKSKDGLSFKVLNTDEPDNLVETTVQMNSKEELEEFQKYINDASINNFNSTS
ncbi:hypothetical protein, partial [uncultured Helicobacter sp.]|uniref:hypothetical protein n=1 Tax=uncultured Helicobacter sp. TaxID=175537 RepID=UPI0026370636